MSFRWALPASRHPEAASCVWLQDGDGRFLGVESGGHVHSEESGDLEAFGPRRCGRCEDRTGWLPPVFEHCPSCGGPLADFAQMPAGPADPHWPCLAWPGDTLPQVARPNRFDLPRGANLVFVRLPLRNRLVAIAGDSGRVWVYSRPGQRWHPLVPAPTGYPAVPPAMFGVLAVDGLLVYATAAGVVWIDTAPVGPATVEVSVWPPAGAPALLGDQVLVPVRDESATLHLATRGLAASTWQWRAVEGADGALSGDPGSGVDGGAWLSLPAVEEDQVHWAGNTGVLHADERGMSTWHAWQAGFEPVLGTRVLETRDGRLWQTGHATDSRGQRSWAFGSLDVHASRECRPVDGAFFVARRLCFRLDMRHMDPPWVQQGWNNQAYPLPENSFLLPLCELGDSGALLLSVRDRSVTTPLLEGRAQVRGELFLSRSPGRLESLRAILSYSTSHRPQVLVWNDMLLVYDPIDSECDCWTLQ